MGLEQTQPSNLRSPRLALGRSHAAAFARRSPQSLVSEDDRRAIIGHHPLLVASANNPRAGQTTDHNRHLIHRVFQKVQVNLNATNSSGPRSEINRSLHLPQANRHHHHRESDSPAFHGLVPLQATPAEKQSLPFYSAAEGRIPDKQKAKKRKSTLQMGIRESGLPEIAAVGNRRWIGPPADDRPMPPGLPGAS